MKLLLDDSSIDEVHRSLCYEVIHVLQRAVSAFCSKELTDSSALEISCLSLVILFLPSCFLDMSCHISELSVF